MNDPYKVNVDGHIVEWKDGAFHCNNRGFLKKLKEILKEVSDAPYVELMLDGTNIYGGKGAEFEKSWLMSYALLQTMTGGRMKFVSGDKPTWEKLGYKAKEGEIN